MKSHGSSRRSPDMDIPMAHTTVCYGSLPLEEIIFNRYVKVLDGTYTGYHRKTSVPTQFCTV